MRPRGPYKETSVERIELYSPKFRSVLLLHWSHFQLMKPAVSIDNGYLLSLVILTRWYRTKTAWFSFIISILHG